MPDINLGFIDCKDCGKDFPIESKPFKFADQRRGKDYLEDVPKYCPFCGSQNLDFKNTSSEYFG